MDKGRKGENRRGGTERGKDGRDGREEGREVRVR